MVKHTAIGIFGGTFDPIHFGHLRSALEVHEALKLDETRLIPCQIPPHRASPFVQANDRLHMVSLAIENSPLKLDDREMRREGPSYTVDTLVSFRQEFPSACLCLIIGMDAFLKLFSWHQWEKLIRLANIIVMHRAGWKLPAQGEMFDFLRKHQLPPMEPIQAFSYGKVLTQPILSLNIQAAMIRSMIALGESPQFLLPEKVLNYIRLHGLYQYNRESNHQEIL